MRSCEADAGERKLLLRRAVPDGDEQLDDSPQALPASADMETDLRASHAPPGAHVPVRAGTGKQLALVPVTSSHVEAPRLGGLAQVAREALSEDAEILLHWSRENQEDADTAKRDIEKLSARIQQQDRRLNTVSFWSKTGGRIISVGAIIVGLCGEKVLAGCGGLLAQLVGGYGDALAYKWAGEKKQLETELSSRKADHQDLLEQQRRITAARETTQRKIAELAAQAQRGILPPGRKGPRRRRRRRTTSRR